MWAKCFQIRVGETIGDDDDDDDDDHGHDHDHDHDHDDDDDAVPTVWCFVTSRAKVMKLLQRVTSLRTTSTFATGQAATTGRPFSCCCIYIYIYMLNDVHISMHLMHFTLWGAKIIESSYTSMYCRVRVGWKQFRRCAFVKRTGTCMFCRQAPFFPYIFDFGLAHMFIFIVSCSDIRCFSFLVYSD